MELFRFKKLTEATYGTAIEHDKYRYIKRRNACELSRRGCGRCAKWLAKALQDRSRWGV